MALTEEQREIRRTGITATQLPAILGKHPFISPWDVWVRKVKPDQAPTIEGAALDRGEDLEPAVANTAARELGHRLEDPQETYRHPDQELVLATPDRFLLDDDGERVALLECKTARYKVDWGTQGTDQVPIHYLYQAHQQIDVCRHLIERPRCYIAVMWGLDDHGVYIVDYDEELAELCHEKIQRWWLDHVEAEVPPKEITGARGERKAIASYYRRDSDEKEYLKPTAMVKKLAEQLYNLEQRYGKLDEEIEKKKAQLQELIGPDYGFEGDFGKILSPQIDGRSRTAHKKVCEVLAERAGVSDEELEDLREEYTTQSDPYRQFRSYWNDDFFAEQSTSDEEEQTNA